MTVSIKREDNTLRVFAPYHPNFPARARELGGQWDPAAKSWCFGHQVEAKVRALCIQVYGKDDTDAEVESVTVHLRCEVRNVQQIYRFGRCIVERPKKDWLKLGEGVSIIAGGFPPMGGSAAHPELLAYSGTILEITDVPKSLVDADPTDVISFKSPVQIELDKQVWDEGIAAAQRALRNVKFFDVTVTRPYIEESFIVRGVPAKSEDVACTAAKNFLLKCGEEFEHAESYSYSAVRVLAFSGEDF